MMKSVVVYYSLSGNTDYAAKAIAAELGADLLRLETVKPYPQGGKRFLLGGADAVRDAQPELKPYAFNDDDYDTVVIAMPLWAWTITPPIRSFAAAHPLKGKKLAFVICSMGGQDKKCFARLHELFGTEKAPHLTLIDPLQKQKNEDQAAIKRFAEEIRSL